MISHAHLSEGFLFIFLTFDLLFPNIILVELKVLLFRFEVIKFLP